MRQGSPFRREDIQMKRDSNIITFRKLNEKRLLNPGIALMTPTAPTLFRIKQMYSARRRTEGLKTFKNM